MGERRGGGRAWEREGEGGEHKEEKGSSGQIP